MFSMPVFSFRLLCRDAETRRPGINLIIKTLYRQHTDSSLFRKETKASRISPGSSRSLTKDEAKARIAAVRVVPSSRYFAPDGRGGGEAGS